MSARLSKITFTAALFLLFCISFSTASESIAAYKDVASSFWGQTYINTLSDKGIIKGYPDGTFQPQKEVNRAEFLKLLVSATSLKLSDGKSITFPDTDRNAWYAPYVEAALTSSIAKGYDDGKFRPEASVNRAEALKMLLRLKLDMDAYIFDSAAALQVKDADSKSWYGPYVNAAMKYHLLDKLLTTSKEALPGQALTRAEAAYLIYQLQFSGSEFALLPLRTISSGAGTKLPTIIASTTRPIADAYTLFTLGGASLINGAPREEKIIIELISGNISTAAFSTKKTLNFDEIKQKIDPGLHTLFQKYQVRSLTSLQNSGLGSGTMFEVRIASGTDASAFLHELTRLPSVLNASLNAEQTPLVLPNDPYIHSKGSWWTYNGYDDQWGLEKINIPDAWEITTGAPELIIAIIDTGVEKNHPDLKGRIWHNSREIANNNIDDDKNGFVDDADGWNFIDNNNNIQDENGHGTHIAGIIGAENDNASGIAGVNAKSKLMILKVFDEEGAGNSITTAKAIKYAVDNGAKVINLSLAGESTKSSSGKMSYDEQMLLYAYQKGVSIVTAAGNQAIDIENVSPANYPYAIAVAASEPYDTPAEVFSNFGKKIDIAAPGADILSTFAPDGYLGKLGNMQSQVFLSTPYTPTLEGKKYAVMQGTSMAAGFVTGTVSLLLSQYPSLQPEAVRNILRLSAKDINDAGFDVQTGMGRLDGKKALDIAPELLQQNGFVSIVSPEKESTLSGVQDIVGVFSTERNISSWKLLLTSANMTSVIAEGRILPNGGPLSSLDTRKIQDGPIKIWLEAVVADGTVLKYESTYTVENISIREKDDVMTSSASTTLTGTSISGISKVDAAWSTGAEEKRENLSITTSTQGFLITFDPEGKVKSGDMVTFRIKITTTTGLHIEKSIQKKVVSDQTVFHFADVLKSCSANLSCKNVPDNGYIIEYGEKREKILVFAHHSELYLISQEGKNLPGWPKKITSYISQAPLFVPVKNAQGQKIMTFVLLDEQGKIHAWDIHGNTVSPLDGKTVNKSGGYVSAFDKDNDGSTEFVITSKVTGGNIGIFDSTGSFLAGWPYISTFAAVKAPAIGDTNGDESQEIFFGDDMGIVYGFSAQGKSLPGWPRQIKGKVAEVHMADLNKDGKPELIVLSQYQSEDRAPKIGLYLLNANGTLYPQGNQEFSGILPSGGALRILDEKIMAIAINGYSALKIQSKVLFLDASGKLISQVLNTTGHTQFGPMTMVSDNKNTSQILTRNEDQALLISSENTSPSILGTLPLARDAEMKDTPLCIESAQGCTPVYSLQSSLGVNIKTFSTLEATKNVQPYAGYNTFRNFNAHLRSSVPFASQQKTAETKGQNTASFTVNSTSEKERRFTIEYQNLPDFSTAPAIRFISRTSVSDPIEIALVKNSSRNYSFTLPLSVEGGIYDVQIGDAVQGYYSIKDLFVVDAKRAESLRVSGITPLTVNNGKKTYLTVRGNGFSPYHEYILHMGTYIFRDGIEVLSPNEMKIPISIGEQGMYEAVLEDVSQGALLKFADKVTISEITAPTEVKFSKTIIAAHKSGFLRIDAKNLPENAKLRFRKDNKEFSADIFQTKRNEEGEIISFIIQYPELREKGTYVLLVKAGTKEFSLGEIHVVDSSVLPTLTRAGKILKAQTLSTIEYSFSGTLTNEAYRLEISSDTFSAAFPVTVSGKTITASIFLPHAGEYTVNLLDASDTEIASDQNALVVSDTQRLKASSEISRFAPSFATQGENIAVKILGKGMNKTKKIMLGSMNASSLHIISEDEVEAYFVIPKDMKEGMYTLDVENMEGVHIQAVKAFEIKKRLVYVQPVISNVAPLKAGTALTKIIITGSEFPKKMKATLGSGIQSRECSVLTSDAACVFDLTGVEKGRYALRFQDTDTGVVYDTGAIIEVGF